MKQYLSVARCLLRLSHFMSSQNPKNVTRNLWQEFHQDRQSETTPCCNCLFLNFRLVGLEPAVLAVIMGRHLSLHLLIERHLNITPVMLLLIFAGYGKFNPFQPVGYYVLTFCGKNWSIFNLTFILFCSLL